MSDSGSISLAEAALAEPYCAFLGVKPVRIAAGNVAIELPYREEISNPGRQVHGGVMSSMLGIAGRAAALSDTAITPPLSAASVEMNAAYLSSAVGEGMIAIGTVLRRGKELVHVRCDLKTAAEKPLATALVIFRIVPGGEAAPAALEGVTPEPARPEVPSIARALAGAPFISAMGTAIDRYESGHAQLRIASRADLLGGDGALHEGAVGALTDTAGALAAWSNVHPKPGMKVSTVSLDLNFASSAPGADAIACARTITRRSEIFFNRVEIITPRGIPIALGSVVYRIVLP